MRARAERTVRAGPLRWLASFLAEQTLARRSTPYNSDLRVTLLRGRRRLDAGRANYSFGELHRVLSEGLAALDLPRREPRSALLLGLGAGSAVHVLHDELGLDCALLAVEVDAVVVELARAHFDLGWRIDRGDVEVLVEDARAFLERDRRAYDLILADVFVGDAVPARCEDEGFLRLAAARLAPGGLLVQNRIAPAREAARRFTQALHPARALPVRGNVLLVHEAPGRSGPVAAGARPAYPRRLG